MKIQPVASPHQIAPTGTSSNAASDAKARAVAMLTQSTPQNQQTAHSAQLNQNAISAEDLSAVRQSQPQNSQPDTTEPAAQEIPQKQEDPATSQEWARLARQEKAIRAKAQASEQALKAREAALAAKEAELAAKDASYKSDYVPKSLFKQNAAQALADAGTSYDELVQQMLNTQPMNPQVEYEMKMLRDQVQELKQANEQSRKASQDQQTQAYQAAVNQIRSDARKLVNSDPAFETIKATNSINDVVELIERVYQKDGELLSVEEAAEQVEDYLLEESMKLTKINKIRQRIGLTAQSTTTKTAQPTAGQTQQQQPTMKTLTNSNASSRQLSAKERAILAFKGELK
jgi:hypothetical protein